eukprot:6293902-Amphidinium_carterae.1
MTDLLAWSFLAARLRMALSVGPAPFDTMEIGTSSHNIRHDLAMAGDDNEVVGVVPADGPTPQLF